MLEDEENLIDKFTPRGSDKALLAMVKWWEKKRLYFNLIILAGVTLGTMGLWHKAWLIGGPLSLFFHIVGHFFFANIFYSIGWGIGILRFYYFKGELMPNQARWLLFVIGAGFSFIFSILHFFLLLDGLVD